MYDLNMLFDRASKNIVSIKDNKFYDKLLIDNYDALLIEIYSL